MNESAAESWMERLAAETPSGELPSFDHIAARAQLEAALESRRRAETQLDWLDAALQSAAICGTALLVIVLGALLD